jgi:tetratricopeptide (TPR) repeat protein
MIFSGRQTLLVKRKSLTLKEPHGKHPVIARGESKGDAFSIKKPVITMSSLGKNGRFANQVFQYAFLKIFAKKYGYQVETPRWIGKSLFGCSDPLASRQYAMITEEDNNFLTNEPSYDKSLMDGVDFWGYFQYHTSYYALYKDYFRSLFQPVSEIKAKLDYALNVLRSKGKIIVGMHLRRSDYGYGYYFIAPNKWYKDWLAGFWDTLEDPILFIASDESEKVASEFSEYNPLTLKDLNIRLQELEFYADFYLLSCCDAMAISNSSFSFAAAMLNEHCRFFFRPHLPTGKLIPFDPWDSLVLFKDARTEDYELKEIALPPNVFANQGPGGNNEYFQDIKNRKNGAMKDYGSTELEKVNEMFQQGCSLISSGDTDGALDILLKVHELDPGHASACHLIGMLYDAQDDMDKAMVYLDQAVRLNPCSISFNKTLADAYFIRQGSVETGMQIYLNILNAYPEDVETLLAIGDVCIAVNKPNEGAVFFKRVLEIDNRNVSAKQRLAAINKTATSTG